MKIPISDVAGRVAAAIVHPRLTTVDATATVGDVAAYFAASSSRRLAVLVQEGRYVGAIGADALAAAAASTTTPARDLAVHDPVVAPDAPAALARDLALATEARRVPVVDADGRLVGVVAIDKHRAGFCGTSV